MWLRCSDLGRSPHFIVWPVCSMEPPFIAAQAGKVDSGLDGGFASVAASDAERDEYRRQDAVAE